MLRKLQVYGVEEYRQDGLIFTFETLMITPGSNLDNIQRPSSFHSGLATKHRGTQEAVAANCIPAIHRLEQISSDQHVGSVAENLLEALRDDPSIAIQVSTYTFSCVEHFMIFCLFFLLIIFLFINLTLKFQKIESV